MSEATSKWQEPAPNSSPVISMVVGRLTRNPNRGARLTARTISRVFGIPDPLSRVIGVACAVSPRHVDVSILYIPGSATSFGDLSRQIASAFGREWGRLTMGEQDAWHRFAAEMLAGIYSREYRRDACDTLLLN